MKANKSVEQNERDPGKLLFQMQTGTNQICNRTKTVQYEDYQFNVTFIGVPPDNPGSTGILPSAFLFILGKEPLICNPGWQHATVAGIARTSRRVGIIVEPMERKGSSAGIFENYACLRWLSARGHEVGINTDQIAIMGMYLGANVATVLSLMARDEEHPRINLQILIDPQFHSCTNNLRREKFAGIRTFRYPNESCNWCNMKELLDLPLNAKAYELSGLPFTSVHLSQRATIHAELDYYCAAVLDGGSSLTYLTYDTGDHDLVTSVGRNVYQTILQNASDELIAFG